MIVLVDAGEGGAGRATFRCPGCRKRTSQRLEPVALGWLRAVEVQFRLLTRPAEADEVHGGPPITADEVAAFRAAMDGPGWPPALS